MFNVGGPEVLVIFLVALIVLGPQQLPKAMRTFGNVMGEIRKVSTSFQAEMRSAMDTVVDSSATEKPQSGSMAAATPAKTSDASSTLDEVVVRNDDAPAAATPIEATGTASPEAAGAPAIDPADRAAG